MDQERKETRMSWKKTLIALAFGALAASLVAQEAKTTEQTTTTTQTTTVSGSVVSYTPGQTIVLKSSDGKTTTYTILPTAEVPAAVELGKRVTLSTEPASDGSGMAMVRRIETTSVDASGQTKRTTEKTEISPSGSSKTTTTTVYGTVTAFQPGQSITIEEPTHQVVTYTVDTESQLPQDLAVGKTVTITTTKTSASENPVARKIVYRSVTKTKVKPQ